MSKKKRGKVLMDQKANSVADLAAVLKLQDVGPSEGRILNAARRRQKVELLKRQKGEDNVKKAPVDVASEMRGTEGVKVRWADMRDLEFAEEWPMAVVHGGLEKSRYTAAFPAVELIEDEDGTTHEFLIDGGDGGMRQGDQSLASPA